MTRIFIYCSYKGLMKMLIISNCSTITWQSADILGCKTSILHCFGMKLPTNWSFNTSPFLTSPHTGSFNCSAMENVGGMNQIPESEAGSYKVSLQMFNMETLSTISNIRLKMFLKTSFSLKSEPVFASFILRGTRHWNVPKLMVYFQMHVHQRDFLQL